MNTHSARKSEPAPEFEGREENPWQWVSLAKTALNGTKEELKPLAFVGERGAAVNVASRDAPTVSEV
jgi:hypothetical protein